MARVVFLLYHGIGHFNPCFRLAKILRPQYEVVFAGHAFFSSYVKDQGFAFYPLKTVPFGLGFELWVNTIEKKKNVYWHSLKDRWTDRLYHLREFELHQLLNNLQPDYLLIDSTQTTDFIVLYDALKTKGIRTAILHANLSPEVEPDLPPLNSPTLPDKVSSVQWARRSFFAQQLKTSVYQWVKYFGKTDNAIVRRRIVQNKIPSKYISDKPAIFSLALDGVDQFILAPREFEFPSAHRSAHQYYLGFMIDSGRVEKADASFESQFNDVKQKVTNGYELIYCSFGTVHYDSLKKVDHFLKKLIDIVSGTKKILIISGNAFDLLKDKKLPENIFFYKSVPNFKVFPIASVFITHGGFNSIKESIYAGVPMIVYPVDKRTDQQGNSARIVYHQMGLRGSLSQDQEEDIRKKIDLLITDRSYKDNIDRIKKSDQHYTEKNFLSPLESIQPIS
jgi:UDP:flavonoid glycosyltransferase YjiC (YdhE family)